MRRADSCQSTPVCNKTILRLPRLRIPAVGVRNFSDGTDCFGRAASLRSGHLDRSRPEAARRSAAHAARPRRRRARSRSADRALHAARPLAGAALPARQRAARRPDPGGVRRPREGRRPLGPRARARVLVLRGADDPRRAAALLPRFHVGRAPGARSAGALPGARGGAREAVGRARPPADRRRPRRAPGAQRGGHRRGAAGDRGPLRALAGRARARRGERLGVGGRPDRLRRQRVRPRRGRRDAWSG